MRALSFLFALMVGLALAFLAPAMAGGHQVATDQMITPMVADTTTESSDLLAESLLSELQFDLTGGIDSAA